ncbi:MAG: response regulator, partial [Caulobacter sp.]|nr:response regulator [Caulobacter sp.]
ILDFSKIEAGELVVERVPMGIRESVEDAVQVLAVAAVKKGIELTSIIDPEVPLAIYGDSTRIQQTLVNLISNAIKFTAKGEVSVSVSSRDMGGHEPHEVQFSVRDTGIGIDSDRLEMMFVAFQQADSSISRRYGGTGLGLTISRELVRLMGGDISVESTLGVGSAFTVSLPLRIAVGPTDPKPSAAPDTAPNPAPSASSRMRVLVAEDNAVNRTVLAEILSQLGLDAVFVEDGGQALQAFEAEPWDLMLMDVQMPVLDGETAIAEIRRKENDAGAAPTPIIALTANVLPDQIAFYRASGMDDHVGKPIDARALLAKVASWGARRSGDGRSRSSGGPA